MSLVFRARLRGGRWPSSCTRTGGISRRKLSADRTLRHRLIPHMSPFRYRDEESSSGLVIGLVAGALAGLAAGVFVAQKTGGLATLRTRLSRTFGAALGQDEDVLEFEDDELDEDYDEDEDLSADASLEERVLEAFRNDPILSERAIDIGAIGDSVIELAGWVDADEEALHAVTVAGGVPGVGTVVNRIAIGEVEEVLADSARRLEEGDPALTVARWEGNRVGTGKRRQGTSAEPDRHADPKPHLEERWLSEQEALRNAAEETEKAERRASTKAAKKGGRADGSPVAPTGVPKADHVADPEAAKDNTRAD